MARLTDTGISGLIGNLVFYTVDGKNYIRSQAGKRSKKRGKTPNPLNTVFGTVSTFGSGMIKRMSSSFLFPFTRATYNSLRGWMRNRYAAHKDDTVWELTAQHSPMCQVNPETDLRDLLLTDITVADNGNGKVSVVIPSIIPKLSVLAPLRTKKVNMKVMAVTSPFRRKGAPNNFCIEEYKFNYSDNAIPAKEIILDTKANVADIAIIVVALEYEMSAGRCNTEMRWLPAAIVAMGKLS